MILFGQTFTCRFATPRFAFRLDRQPQLFCRSNAHENSTASVHSYRSGLQRGHNIKALPLVFLDPAIEAERLGHLSNMALKLSKFIARMFVISMGFST